MKIIIKSVDTRNQGICSVLLYLQKKCLPSDEPYDVSKGHWWIAYTEDGRPVAFAGITRSTPWYNCGYLCRAGVIDEFTGHGLQKRLIAVREKKAKALGWEWIITDTTDNPASANSLINAGFKIYSPSVKWAYKHSIYWRKRINALPGQRKAKRSPKKALQS